MSYPLWEMKDTTNAYLGLFWILCRYKHFLCPKCFSGFLFLLLYLHLVLFLFRFWRIFLFKINCFENEKIRLVLCLHDQQYKWKEEPDEGAQPQHGVHRQWQHSRARRRPPAIDSMNTKMEESDDYWNINSNFVIATIVIAMLNIIAILGWRPTSLLNCGIPRACSTSPLFH